MSGWFPWVRENKKKHPRDELEKCHHPNDTVRATINNNNNNSKKKMRKEERRIRTMKKERFNTVYQLRFITGFFKEKKNYGKKLKKKNKKASSYKEVHTHTACGSGTVSLLIFFSSLHLHQRTLTLECGWFT